MRPSTKASIAQHGCLTDNPRVLYFVSVSKYGTDVIPGRFQCNGQAFHAHTLNRPTRRKPAIPGRAIGHSPTRPVS